MIIKGKEFIIDLKGEQFHCALDVTMRYVGGKWKSVIVWYLRKGGLRFSELKRQIPDMTEKMLSLQLKALEKDGIINREILERKPLKVEYSLSEFGNSLLPVVESMAKWGRNYAETEGVYREKTKELSKRA